MGDTEALRGVSKASVPFWVRVGRLASAISLPNSPPLPGLPWGAMRNPWVRFHRVFSAETPEAQPTRDGSWAWLVSRASAPSQKDASVIETCLFLLKRG